MSACKQRIMWGKSCGTCVPTNPLIKQKNYRWTDALKNDKNAKL